MQGKTDKKDLACYACGCVIPIDHTGIRCPQSHHLCTDCSPNFVKHVLENPQVNIPVKCMTCKSEVVVSTFERQLDDNQRSIFMAYMVQQSLGDGDKMVFCPECSYAEIWSQAACQFATFLFCKGADCQKTSCYWCKKQCLAMTADDEDGDDESYQAKYSDPQSGMEIHFMCAELGPLFNEFMETVHKGATQQCPGCGLAGMKDDACTHMNCDSCGTSWCYVCGKQESDVDKEDSAGNIYSHNVDWPDNVRRCPMYLTEISDVDLTWPDTDEEALAKLHHHLTLKRLRAWYDKHGRAQYTALAAKFTTVTNCGFSEQEIVGFNPNQPPFQRQ